MAEKRSVQAKAALKNTEATAKEKQNPIPKGKKLPARVAIKDIDDATVNGPFCAQSAPEKAIDKPLNDEGK